MCLICYPFCGRCKPARMRAIICPKCETYNFLSLLQPEKVDHCEKCGLELPKPVPKVRVRCLWSGLMCSYPCNKQKCKPANGVLVPCLRNTEDQSILSAE